MKNFDRSLPMLMHRALGAIMPCFRAIFRRFNLTERQWRVLRVLWEADGTSSGALAERTLIPAPSLVGVIDRLQQDNRVERRQSTSDRRSALVWLTDAGRALQQEVSPLVDTAYAELQESISTQEWRMLTTTLEKIAAQANGRSNARRNEAKQRR